MGRGISPLQQEVLDVLRSVPALQDCARTESGQVLVAAFTALRGIIAVIGRASTPNRFSVSRPPQARRSREHAKMRSTVVSVCGGCRYAWIRKAKGDDVG